MNNNKKKNTHSNFSNALLSFLGISIVMSIFYFSIKDVFNIFEQFQNNDGKNKQANSKTNVKKEKIKAKEKIGKIEKVKTKDPEFQMEDKKNIITNNNFLKVNKIDNEKKEQMQRSDLRRNDRQRNGLKVVRYGRRVLGLGVDRFKNDNKKLFMVNNYSEEWLDRLKSELKNSNNNKTRFSIEVEDSFIQLESNGLGRFVERVIISTTLSDGSSNSFSAKIDSETGKIIETWHANIFEFNEPKQIIQPSGTM
ncbi:MAG: hypothetical protein HQK51_18630 [Oligoflexia bacterium]|nr:hypothetical protein [Oligoflexia bacterium]